MRSARLDATDWRILRELQADGRITNVDLARKVGISAPPCLRRVRALEEAGIIKGFTALLNDKALGFDVTAFAMIRLHSQAEADLIAFEERARSSPIVRDCYMLSGEIDIGDAPVGLQFAQDPPIGGICLLYTSPSPRDRS